MAKKRDQKKRNIAQAQKQRQQAKALTPSEPSPPFEARQSQAQPPQESVRAGAEALLLTVSDVCALLQISRATFYRLQKSGGVPGRVDLGGHVRYHRPTLEDWLLSKIKE